jgi:drug/metabolite transporter (DMT)-like permease
VAGDGLRVSRVSVVGVVAGVLAAVGQAGGAVIGRKGFAAAWEAGVAVDGLTSAYMRILGGLPVLCVWVILMGMRGRGMGDRSKRWSWEGWRHVVAHAVTGPALGVGCYMWALAEAPSALVLPIVALTPVVTILMAWAMHGDRPTRRAVVGSLVAVAGASALAGWRAYH